MSTARQDVLVAAASDWALSDERVRALLLKGSLARGQGDERLDVDLVIVTGPGRLGELWAVALIGFGIDSAIEGFASGIIVWRWASSRVDSEAAEQRAQKLVAIQFFVLAPYVGYESVMALIEGDRPDVSWLGIALSASSVIVMPYLGVAKQRLADQLGSAATKGEGRQNMLCAYLAAALLVGLLGNATFGAWWLDPIVGLLIAAVAVNEGLEAWRGEGCACLGDPLAGLSDSDDGRKD